MKFDAKNAAMRFLSVFLAAALVMLATPTFGEIAYADTDDENTVLIVNDFSEITSGANN